MNPEKQKVKSHQNLQIRSQNEHQTSSDDLMCKSKMSVKVTEPVPVASKSRTTDATTLGSSSRTPKAASRSPRRSPMSPFAKTPSKLSSTVSTTGSYSYGSKSESNNYDGLDTGTTSGTSLTSLSSLHLSLPENVYIYGFSEIRTATNNFLAKRFSTTSSSSSQSWRCSLNGRDVVIFQRKFHKSIEQSDLKSRLSTICKSHHSSIIKLLGSCISNGHIYLVYDYVSGSNLAECLRNPRNPSFTVLSTWMSRMQIAADLAHGLEYIHNTAGFNINLVHKHLKSSAVIITDPSLNAKLCHFGAADLCGETERKEEIELSKNGFPGMEISKSGESQFEGVRGYMSPEFKSTGVATQKSDVYAFGVIILELLTGEEPVKYKYDKNTGECWRISVIDTATEAVDGGGDGGGGVESRLRRWVDNRLKDSFPMEVAEKLTRIALDCVHVDADIRPNMRRVAGKISKLYLESKRWSETISLPTDITVSLGPR